jgi:hypothetical protein
MNVQKLVFGPWQFLWWMDEISEIKVLVRGIFFEDEHSEIKFSGRGS